LCAVITALLAEPAHSCNGCCITGRLVGQINICVLHRFYHFRTDIYIRSDWGGRSSRLVKQKVALKKTSKTNTKISLKSLYLKTIKRRYIYSSIEEFEVVLVFECNNAGLKKREQTSVF
jgi:hypothetical protein